MWFARIKYSKIFFLFYKNYSGSFTYLQKKRLIQDS